MGGLHLLAQKRAAIRQPVGSWFSIDILYLLQAQRDQVVGKIPNDLALITAFVRLLTPSFPLIFLTWTLAVFSEI